MFPLGTNQTDQRRQSESSWSETEATVAYVCEMLLFIRSTTENNLKLKPTQSEDNSVIVCEAGYVGNDKISFDLDNVYQV